MGSAACMGCKKDTPEQRGHSAAAADYRSACSGAFEHLPLGAGPLGGELALEKAAKPLDLKNASLTPGGLAFEGADGRVLLPVPWAGRDAVDLEVGPHHLQRAPKPPAIRGQIGDLGHKIEYRALRLQLGPTTDGRARGRITLCLSAPNGFLSGSFDARVDEDISDAPDLTRDHVSILRYLARRRLQNIGVVDAKGGVWHRRVWLGDADATGYDHVAFGQKFTKSMTLTFRKQDGSWRFNRQFAGNEVPEAHPAKEPADPKAIVVAEAARRLEATARGALEASGFSSRIHFDSKNSVIRMSVLPDDRKKGEPMSWELSVKATEPGKFEIARVATTRGPIALIK